MLGSASSANERLADNYRAVTVHEEGKLLIPGSCHCGNIKFEFVWLPDPSEIPARACTCSFCRKHGAVWTSCPSGSLKIFARDPELVTRYAFDTRTAEFHVCAVCGVSPVATSKINEQLFAVVNVNVFAGEALALLKHSPISHDGENRESRLDRRARNWIADVQQVH